MPTQLSYTLTNATPAVYPGTQATLKLTATLPKDQSADIQSITLDLTAVADLSVNVTADTGLSDWNCYDSSNSPQSLTPGRVTLQPTPSPTTLSASASDSLTLTFSIALLVTSSTGLKDVLLTEYKSTTDFVGTPDTLTVNVSDEIDGIYTFVATETVMNSGGSTALNWTGSSDYTYTLTRSDDVNTGIKDQQLQAGGNGNYPQTGPLNQNTTFTLTAQDTEEVQASLTVSIRQPSDFTCSLEGSSGATGETITVDLYDKVTVNYSAANITQVALYDGTALVTDPPIDTTNQANSAQTQDPPLVTGTIDIMATRNATLTLQVTGNGVTLTKNLTLNIAEPRIEASLTKTEVYIDADSYQTQIDYTYANANAIYYALGGNTETELHPLDPSNLTLKVEPTMSETISVRADLVDNQDTRIPLWGTEPVPEMPTSPPASNAPSSVDMPFSIVGADVLFAKDSNGNSTFTLKPSTEDFKITFSEPVGFWTVLVEKFRLEADDDGDHTKSGRSKFAEIQLSPGVSIASDNKTVTVSPTIKLKDKSKNRTYTNDSYIKMRVMGVPEGKTNILATRADVTTNPLTIQSDQTGDLYSITQSAHWTGNDSGDDHSFQQARWAMDLTGVNRSNGQTTFSPSMNTDIYNVDKGVTFAGWHTVFAENTSSEGCGYELLNVALPWNNSDSQTSSGSHTCLHSVKAVYYALRDFNMNTQDSDPAKIMYFYSGSATSVSHSGSKVSYSLESPAFQGEIWDGSYHTGHGNGGNVLFLIIYDGH